MPDTRMRFHQADPDLIDYEMDLPGNVILRLTVGRADLNGKSGLNLPYLTLAKVDGEAGIEDVHEVSIAQVTANALLTDAEHNPAVLPFIG